MRTRAVHFIVTILSSVGMALACSGPTHVLKGEETQPGVFNVYSSPGIVPHPTLSQWSLTGISRTSDFKAYLDSVIANHSLVFIARIDSSISPLDWVPYRDTIVAGLRPDIVLATRGSSHIAGFYVHLVVDTVLKGKLPAKRMWIKSYAQDQTCGLNPFVIENRIPFLNFSNGLDSTKDLNLNIEKRFNTFCKNCPDAHWFDGQYLRSPRFPVLSLDIREALPGFPVALMGAKPRVRIPLRLDGKVYRPDGRVAPEGLDRHYPALLLR